MVLHLGNWAIYSLLRVRRRRARQTRDGDGRKGKSDGAGPAAREDDNVGKDAGSRERGLDQNGRRSGETTRRWLHVLYVAGQRPQLTMPDTRTSEWSQRYDLSCLVDPTLFVFSPDQRAGSSSAKGTVNDNPNAVCDWGATVQQSPGCRLRVSSASTHIAKPSHGLCMHKGPRTRRHHFYLLYC